MCGILGVVRRTFPVGASKDSNDKLKETFKSVLKRSRARGADSSGMFILNKEHKYSGWTGTVNSTIVKSHPLVVFNKAPLPADKYIESDDYKNAIDYVSDWTVSMVGHTRMATQGSPINNKNNHPFKHGNIIGVHNGVIDNWEHISNKHSLPLEGKCDSEVIFSLINEHMEKGATLIEAIEESCKELVGPMACAIADVAKPTSLVLLRRGRPLSIRVTDRPHPTVLFASEDGYLKKAFKDLNKPGKGLAILDWNKAKLNDNTMVVLDTTVAVADWVAEATKVQLS